MKIFGTYCLLLCLLGSFGIKPFMLKDLQDSVSLIHDCCTDEAEDAKNMQLGNNCCEKPPATKEDSPNKKDCDTENHGKECDGKNDCTRTCCSSITGFIPNITIYDYHLSDYQKKYSSLFLTHLPAPYLGKITPPPNC